jgi:predicted amidohydrolase
MANQGYGGGSPLTYAAQMAIDANKMGSDSAAERGARWDAASGNANFQQAGEIASGKLANDYLNALISSQAQMLNMFQTNQQARASLLNNALSQIFS